MDWSIECPQCGDIETLTAEYPRKFEIPDPLITECRECE